MKLPGFFKKQNTDFSHEDSYLALTLTPEKVIATVWDFFGDEIKIKATSERPFSDPQNLIHETAVAIDTACQSADTDVQKVVFGLSQSYFEGNDVSQESAKILKNLSTDLELDAQAFVSLAASINHFLKVTEGVTPSAILVGIFAGASSTFCEVHKVFGSKVVASKSSSQILSVEKIIALVGQLKEEDEVLPGRIVIYGNPPAEMVDKIKSASWQNLFTSEPKLSVLAVESLGQSVAYAQAADILGHDPMEVSGEKGEQPKQEEEEPKTLGEEPDGLGFVAGVDIAEASKLQKDEQPVKTSAPLPREQVKKHLRNEDYAVEVEGYEQEYARVPSAPKMPSVKMPKFRMPHLPTPSKKLGIVLGGLLLAIVIGIFVAGQTLTSAVVDIKVSAKSQDGNFTAKVVPGADFNQGQSQIPGQLVKGSASGSVKGVATGTKKAGNHAKGPVNLRNWANDQPITFKSGTEIITRDSNAVKFTLDSDVTVPGVTLDSSQNHVAGIAQGNVTAEDVGPTYNIGTSKNLGIVGQEFLSYDAASIDPGITGGDEKQITVVSQDDLDKLAKSQTDNLTQKAKDDLKTKSNGANIIDGAVTINITRKDFDKKVDDEAALVTLNMEVSANAVSYNPLDLQKLINGNFQDQSGLTSRPEDIEVSSLGAKRVKDTLSISGNYSAKLIPKLDQDKLAQEIAGKSVKEARAIIRQTPQISDVLVSFSPAIPFVDSIPRDKSKIKFKIEIS